MHQNQKQGLNDTKKTGPAGTGESNSFIFTADAFCCIGSF